MTSTYIQDGNCCHLQDWREQLQDTLVGLHVRFGLAACYRDGTQFSLMLAKEHQSNKKEEDRLKHELHIAIMQRAKAKCHKNGTDHSNDPFVTATQLPRDSL